MPEYPDIENYVQALSDRIVGRKLVGWSFKHPFLLRTVEPLPELFVGRSIVAVRRQEKRIILQFETGMCAAVHLMVAGRLHWRPAVSRSASRQSSPSVRRSVARNGPLWEALFGDSAKGTAISGMLTLTEAGSKRMASIHLFADERGAAVLHRGGLDPFACSTKEFAERLRMENHTIKRSLTDQRMVSGIGNAYSDEILHTAHMSPFRQTAKMTDREFELLLDAIRDTLTFWRDRLAEERGDGFPEKVTAFHKLMAVHGKFGKPCPSCGTTVQRVKYAENECNYCPTCQTGGTIYADRALSRLLKSDWPRTVEELERLPGIGPS